MHLHGFVFFLWDFVLTEYLLQIFRFYYYHFKSIFDYLQYFVVSFGCNISIQRTFWTFWKWSFNVVDTFLNLSLFLSFSVLWCSMLLYVVALSLVALSWAQDCQVANFQVMQNFDRNRVSWSYIVISLTLNILCLNAEWCVDFSFTVCRNMVCCRQEGPRGFVLTWQYRGPVYCCRRWKNDSYCQGQSHYTQVSSVFFSVKTKSVSSLHYLSPSFSLLFHNVVFPLWPPAIGKCVPTCWPPSRKHLTLPSSGWSTGESHPTCRLEVSCGACEPVHTQVLTNLLALTWTWGFLWFTLNSRRLKYEALYKHDLKSQIVWGLDVTLQNRLLTFRLDVIININTSTCHYLWQAQELENF